MFKSCRLNFSMMNLFNNKLFSPSYLTLFCPYLNISTWLTTKGLQIDNFFGRFGYSDLFSIISASKLDKTGDYFRYTKNYRKKNVPKFSGITIFLITSFFQPKKVLRTKKGWQIELGYQARVNWENGRTPSPQLSKSVILFFQFWTTKVFVDS